MRIVLLFCLCCCLHTEGYTQWLPPSLRTKDNGLPSNVVYQSISDQQGFLWLATDQGVARYDGKQVQVYAREQGVPDIEVMQLEVDHYGRIWIRCYNDGLAFYHPAKNCFIDVTKLLDKLGIRHVKHIAAHPEGGMRFDTDSNSVYISEGITIGQKPIQTRSGEFLIQVISNKQLITYSRPLTKTSDSTIHIRYINGREVIADYPTGIKVKNQICATFNGRFYLFDRGERNYTLISPAKNSFTKPSIQEFQFQQPYYSHHFTTDYLVSLQRMRDNVSGKDVMKPDVYDVLSGQFLFRLDDPFITFHVQRDTAGRLWASTLEHGLAFYNLPGAAQQALKGANRLDMFYSVTGTTDGAIYAGNDKGNIVVIKNGIEQVFHVPSKHGVEWQRNIMVQQGKVFCFSDGGIYIDFNREITLPDRQHIESKVVCRLNDSIIFSGSGDRLVRINTMKETAEALSLSGKQITAIASEHATSLWVGTTEGLFRYDLTSRQLKPLQSDHPALKERIVAFTNLHNELTWVATATNGLLSLQKDQVVHHITVADGLPSNNLSALTTLENGELWIAHIRGLSRFRLQTAAGKPIFTMQHLSAIDGLPDAPIHQLYAQGQRVYAATEKGLYVVQHKNYTPQIPVALTQVKINGQDTLISNSYNLKPEQRNIILYFSGIEAGGYFSYAEYSMDKGNTWTALPGSVLRQEFSHGSHEVMLRAVNVNNHVSESTLTVFFNIATPYWKQWWFWVVVMIAIQAVIGYAFWLRQQRKEKARQQHELAKAHLASLEQQAFTSLMNPHFMFNALNSIQHYINHQDRQNANRYLSDFASLIRKNFEAAQMAFVPLEQEMENISLYLRLESMRFHQKFHYTIELDDLIEPEDWMMPTMILQPLVENAILHGIMPSKQTGQLDIYMAIEDGDLIVSVTDNGIGIEQSKVMKQGSSHRSRGMELIHKRLHALSFFCRQEIHLHYSVPFDDVNNPGSRVQLRIPAALYQLWKNAQRDNRNESARPGI